MKVEMIGTIDTIMHDHIKKITPTSKTQGIDKFPKEADVSYSKMWIVLEGSDPENPWWLEVERPMIPECEWKYREKQVTSHLKSYSRQPIRSGMKIKVTLEILEEG